VDESALEEILRRFNRLEDRLNDHEQRLRAFERERGLEAISGSRPPTPPPVQDQSLPPVYKSPAPPLNAVFEAPPVRKSIDAEYQIGAKVLPYTGGAVVIIGLAYLVSLAVGRGLITPAMLWWGVNLISLLFIGGGQWKREEKEQFGQILTAVGSCGLYLNFAAGHVFQHLYEGETLVGLFMALSFVNLGYAFWRSSRAFLGLGFMGGMIAALMPLKEHNYNVHIALYFLILVPGILIAAKNKWLAASASTYVVGSLALLPVAIDTHTPNELRVFAILAAAVLSVTGYAWCYRDTEVDPQGAFIPAALFTSGLIGFLCLRDDAGALAMILYGAAIALASFLLKQPKPRQLMLGSAVAIPAIIAPFGYFLPAHKGELGLAAWIFLGLAVAFALLSRRRAAKAFSILGTGEFFLALTTYLFQLSENGLPWQTESLFLAVSGAVLALLAWTLVKAHGNTEPLVLSASVLAVPFATRIVQLLLGSPELHATDILGVSYGLLVATAGALVLARLSKWESAVILAWSVLLLGLAAFVGSVLSPHLSLSVELSLLFGFGASVAAAGVVAADTAKDKLSIWSVVAAIGGLLFVRLGDVLLTLPQVDLRHPTAIMLSAALVVFTCAAVAYRKKLTGIAVVAGLFTLASGLFYGAIFEGTRLPFGQDVLAVLLVLASIVSTCIAIVRSEGEKDVIYYFSAFFAWMFASRLGYLLLSDANVGIKGDASISIAWTIYALVLMTVGFRLHLRQLRYMSFAVLGATVVKVLLVDLSNLDPILRVLILLLLGMVMLGGGYWYIRARKPEPA
jgi:uncharacterized membrane protein